MKKRIIALLLTFVMVLGMLPIGSLAAEESITVTVTAQQETNFLLGKTEVTVTDGIAEEYGYENAMDVTGITALDVLVAVHKQIYGDAFTKATPSKYLTMSGGNPVEMFDNNAKSGSLSGFAINHQYPMDSLKMGYMVNSAPVSNGDTLEFFYYSKTQNDYLSWFVDNKGEPIHEITVPANETFTAKLMGFQYGAGYSNPVPISLYQADGALNICTVDANNEITATEFNLTSEEGTQVSFSKVGTYQVTASGLCDEEGNLPVLMPWLNVNVTAPLSEDQKEQIIATDKEVLTFETIKGSNKGIDQITSTLKLPKGGASGKTSITWASSNTDVITNDGTVIRPLNNAIDASISLTATIAYGETKQTKTFDVTVKKLPSDAEVLDTVRAKLLTSLRPQEWNRAGTEKQDTNIIDMVQALVNKENPAAKVDSICVPSEHQTQIATDGTITYNDKSAISQKVVFTLLLGESRLEYAPNVTVIKKKATKEDALRADWLTFDVIKGTNMATNDVKANLQLPKEDSKSYYTELAWTSSNPEIINISSYATNEKFAATVTRPRAGESAASVTLTAKIQPGSYWSFMAPVGPMPSPAYGTKTFELTVPAMSQEEQDAAQAMVDDAIELYSLDGVTIRDSDGTDAKADLMALTYSINDIPYNWKYVNKLPGFKQGYRDIKVQWSTTNPGFVDGKIDSGATVVRTDADQEGKISLTLSNNGARAVKEWDSKILAFSAADAKEENDLLQELSNALTFDKIRKDNELPSTIVSDLALYEGAEKTSKGEISFGKKTYHKPGAQITWTSSNEKVIKVSWNGLKVTRPAKTTEVTLTATLTSPMFSTAPGVKTFTKEFKLNVLPKQATANDVLLCKIAETYTAKDASWWNANGDWWHAIGLTAYADYTGSKQVVSAEAKQTFVNKAISDVVGASGSSAKDANKLANAINGLSALGYDAAKLQTVNHTDVNAVAKLKAIKIEDAKKDWYSSIAPYVLLALKQGEFNSSAQERAHIAYLLEELSAEKNWEWGVDTPCMILQGLIPYYQQTEVKAAVDSALDKLSKMQGKNGSYGNVNADAMATISLAMLGINPDKDTRFVKGQNSLFDGLLSYKSASGDSFGNDYATKQGVLALVSALQVMNTGQAYHPFDCTDIQKGPIGATGSGTPSKPAEPSGDQDITVYFTLKTHNSTWISGRAVSVKNDAKVYHAFKKILDVLGYTYEGAEASYISSITNPEKTTLAEFSNGKNSGWLYKVNGKLPDVGICEYSLKSGDNILFYYTEDWTKDEDAGKMGGGSTTKPEEKTVDKPSVDGSGTVSVDVNTEAKIDTKGNATATVDKTMVEKAINEVIRAAEGKKNAKKEVNLEIKADKNAKKVETTIPKEAFQKLNETVGTVKLSTPVADLSMDEKVLKTIAKEAGGDVKIAVAKVDISQNNKISEKTKKLINDKPVYDFKITSGSKKISQFGGKVTVNLPYTPEKGEDTRKLTVYYIDDEGKIKEMAGARYHAETGSIAFDTDHFSTFAVAYDESKSVFTDVAVDDWFFDAVCNAVSNKLFYGTTETTFSPNANMTRAMFFTVLHRLSGDTQFTDGKNWYDAGMEWAKAKGISDGTNPDGEITREQLVTMLWRYKNSPVLADYTGLSVFTDVQEVSDWAVQAIQWAHEKDIVNGRTATTLAPKQGATRADVATVIMRFLEDEKVV